jgi:pimeloyl-ACP methyl ester carboxylesterase
MVADAHYDEFTVEFDEEVARDLRRRLAEARWPAGRTAASKSETDTQILRELITAWSEFDVQACAKSINKFRHIRARVDGEFVHAIYERGVGPRPLPIVLTHGWPSTFWEYSALIPLLTDPGGHGGDPEDAFDVIAPSLPGYGFSQAPASPDFGDADIANRWARFIVDGIGYERFGAHGSDVGARVTARLSRQHPDRLVGIHLSAFGLPLPSDTPTLEEIEYARMLGTWRSEEGAYIDIQSTRPQTLGYALTDSPIGLAAWFLEKYLTWSDGESQSLSGLPLNWVLTTLTIYWMTGTAASSFQPYYSMRRNLPLSEEDRVETPVALARFPHERVLMPSPPRSLAERYFNVVSCNEYTSGGHFPAVERPMALANDIRDFFRPLRSGDGDVT